MMSNNKEKKQITLSTTAELHDEVKTICDRIGITMSEFVRHAIYVMLDAEKRMKKEANKNT